MKGAYTVHGAEHAKPDCILIGACTAASGCSCSCTVVIALHWRRLAVVCPGPRSRAHPAACAHRSPPAFHHTTLAPPLCDPAGTGSELVMAVDAAKKLESEGKKVRESRQGMKPPGMPVQRDMEGGQHGGAAIVLAVPRSIRFTCIACLVHLYCLPQVRVVSMPCWELFEEQSQEYKDSVLLPEVSSSSVTSRSHLKWRRQLGAATAGGGASLLSFRVPVSSSGRRTEGHHQLAPPIPSSPGDRPRVRGGRRDLWLGEVGGPEGQVHRHQRVWCLRARPPAVREGAPPPPRGAGSFPLLLRLLLLLSACLPACSPRLPPSCCCPCLPAREGGTLRVASGARTARPCVNSARP